MRFLCVTGRWQEGNEPWGCCRGTWSKTSKGVGETDAGQTQGGLNTSLKMKLSSQNTVKAG